MSFTEVNPGGWALNELLTSAQMNALQSRIVNAVDGVDGGTYPLQSDLQFDGPASLLIGGTLETLNGAQQDFASGSALNLLSGSVTTLEGLLTVPTGGVVSVGSGGTWNVLAGAIANIGAGAVLNVLGTARVDFENGAELRMEGGSDLELENGADLRVQDGADINVLLNGVETIFSGGRFNALAGAELRFNGGIDSLIEDVDDFAVDDQPVTFYARLIDGRGSSEWTELTGSVIWRQSTVSTAGVVTFVLPIKQGDDIVSVRVRLDGAHGASHGSIPVGGDLPDVQVSRYDPETGIATTLGAIVVDPSPNLAAYEVPHDILVNNGNHAGLPDTAGANDMYFVSITGEAGPNAIANALAIIGIEVTCTARTLRATGEVH